MLYWILRPLMWLFYKLFYPMKVWGKENCVESGKNIVICNHLGKSDVLLIGALYKNKTYFMAKIEWFDNKVFGWILRNLGAIPLDRDKPSLSSIKEGLTVLKNNNRLAIFPEGRRNFVDNTLQEIKQGTALFAVKGQVAITPVIIHEKIRVFKKNYAIVGKPIDFSEFYNVKFTEEVSAKCTEIIKERMLALQKEVAALVEEEKSRKKKK